MPEWTRQQQDAIYARQGTLLVSAAAGSGKTAVLVERILQAVLDEEHPANVDDFLVVTFTNAAAAEMRQRIGEGLSEAVRRSGSNPRLTRQQMLLPGAHICTIDAFCIQLVREHFSQLPIEQDFRILDDAALSLLKAQALDEVLGGQYAAGNPAFLSLVELLSGARDDRKLGDAVEKLYDYIMTHPFPKQWLEGMCGQYRSEAPLQDSAWGTLIRDHTLQSLQYGITQLEGAVSLAEQEETLREKLCPVLDTDLAAVKALYNTLEQDGWDASRQALQEVSMARMPVIRGYKEHPLKLAAAARRETVKKIIQECRELFGTSEAEHRADMDRLLPLVEALADTVRQFYDRLLELKQRENAYSFGDIEHFALRLLVRQAQDGYAPTQLAQQMQARYREILVDEYQDTNRAQDLLFEALSGGDNLFMVGDVKQSIYRFRQAMPKIFMEKKRAFVPYDRNAPAFPARIALDRNFRSRASVCDFVNFTFGLLMSESVGELDYRGEERLQAGTSYPSGDEDCVQLHLLDTSSAAKGEKGRYEAAYIVGLIQEMVNSAKTVVDHGVERPVEYGDIAVLFRSAGGHIPYYAQVFREAGIPVWSQTASDLFAEPEVAAMLALFQVIDNPMQDIPLLSVLLSPIYGFTPDDLAQMRTDDRDASLYQCLVHAAQAGGGKAAVFLESLQRLRTYCVTLESAQAVQKIYDETAYPAIAAGMGSARRRQANLNLLADYAAGHSGSFSSFVRFLCRLRESGRGLRGTAAGAAGGAVQLMSIHRSKGLEFPVCILAGNSRKYDQSSQRDDLLLHPDLGAGLKVLEEEQGYRYKTIPYQAVQLAIRNAEMSESLRVLYVAMTRARENLIFILSEENPRQAVRNAARKLDGGRIDPYVVGRAARDADWLLCCALLHEDGGVLRELADCEIAPLKGQGRLSVRFIGDAYTRTQAESPEEAGPCAEPDEGVVREIAKRLAYQYPYRALSQLLSKRAASSLDEPKEEDAGFAVSRPAFLSQGGLTPGQRGTAMHAFMQYCDYRGAQTDLEAEIRRLAEAGFLSEEEAQALERGKLNTFFHGPLARRMFSSPKLMREIRFSTFVKASRLYSELGEAYDENVFVQGIADCVFEEDGALVVVDYKTDRVKEADVLLERYRSQLSFYKEAIEKTLEQPVRECLLYSFHHGRALRYDFLGKAPVLPAGQ